MSIKEEFERLADESPEGGQAKEVLLVIADEVNFLLSARSKVDSSYAAAAEMLESLLRGPRAPEGPPAGAPGA